VLVTINGNFYSRSADRVRQVFIFIFGVDDEDLRAENKRADNFKLDGVTFTGTGLCKYDGVGIFE